MPSRMTTFAIAVTLILILMLPGAADAATNKVRLAVQGMVCEGSAKTVTDCLSQCKGVEDVTADLKNGTVIVEYDQSNCSSEILMAAVSGVGFKCSDDINAFAGKSNSDGCALLTSKTGCTTTPADGKTPACCAAKTASKANAEAEKETKETAHASCPHMSKNTDQAANSAEAKKDAKSDAQSEQVKGSEPN